MNAFAAKVAEWSGGRVDLLVNNAGQGRVSTFANTTDAQWREELDLKFFSQILPIRAFRPLLDGKPRLRPSSRSIPCSRCSRNRIWFAPPRRAPACKIS